MNSIRNRRSLLSLGALGLMAVTAAACSDSTGSNTARVSLALTDQPGDVDSVWVEIQEIYLQGGGNGANGRVPLLTEDEADGLGLIELTQLAGTTIDLVTDVEIPAGNYGQLRFVVEGAVLQTEGESEGEVGEVYTYNATHPHGEPATGSLTCPSCGQTGIKVLLPGNIANLEAGSHLIVLDFDVSQSFGHEAGQPTKWVMHPVIRGAELQFTGNVSGIVDVAAGVTIPECPAGTARDVSAFFPRAVAQNLTDDLNDPIVVGTPVASDGTFTFPALVPDQYDLTYAPEVAFGLDTITFVASAPGITDVASGSDVVVGYTITSATCNTNP